MCLKYSGYNNTSLNISKYIIKYFQTNGIDMQMVVAIIRHFRIPQPLYMSLKLGARDNLYQNNSFYVHCTFTPENDNLYPMCIYLQKYIKPS